MRSLRPTLGITLLWGTAIVGVILTATPAAESAGVEETTRAVRRALERLPYYGVFDYMTFAVDDGTVTLLGYAYQPRLKPAAERATRRAAGADSVANRLEVLPSSALDDRIRWATFYRIYTDASLSRYAPGGERGALREVLDSRRFLGVQPVGRYPIHIIVKRGRTTLHGEVGNESDKQLAGIRAREVTGVFAVANELMVPADLDRNRTQE
jgi:hyperosmotically inducible periplasmic protein